MCVCVCERERGRESERERERERARDCAYLSVKCARAAVHSFHMYSCVQVGDIICILNNCMSRYP